ncbi:hypothetical protein [Leptolyngbya sp. FACHB-17]|uniref:hypothetical protein n=1 Tax=unclassified Leptolyngbya TaxID=2650499 RepID=UPI0016801B9C|nr:hypothetical protein [Leptolyngbya sp. FACHB-17]MBD2081151.1 hypothetical protein [Leptolyngbya sp. FACHB-17]
MSEKVSEKEDIPFQTPNPSALKQAAKEDPLQEEYLGSNEATVADVLPQGQNVDQPDPFADSTTSKTPEENQTIRANISGH